MGNQGACRAQNPVRRRSSAAGSHSTLMLAEGADAFMLAIEWRQDVRHCQSVHE